MALKTYTRRAPDRNQEMTAAAVINLNDEDDRNYLQSVVLASRQQSITSWKWFDRIGTIHKAISRSARIAGYAKLRAVKMNPDGTDGDDLKGLPRDVVSQIYSPWGGTRGLIDRFFSLMKVPGDGYLIRNVDAQGFDGFHFVSTSEIDKDSIDQISGVPDRPISWNTLPRDPTGRTARIHREVQPNDWLGRAWLPGRQYVDMADSPLMALKTECEVLHTLTLSIKGRLRSRFALAGILFVPSDITDVVVGTGERKTMDILDYLSKATATNVTRYDEASVALPIYMRGKGEAGEQIKWITIDRELIEQDLQLRSQLIEEILFGLDIQPAATKGDGQQNHWGMWATSDEEIRVAVQPDLDVLAWCLTRLILHPALEDAGWGMERIMKTKVAWDVSESAVRTNKTEDTRQAHDLGLAGGKAVMRVTGLGDEDMMSYEERARWTGRLTKNAYLMLDPPKSPEEIDWDKLEKFAGTAKPGTAPDSPTEPSSVGPGVGDPGSPGGADRDTPKKETPS